MQVNSLTTSARATITVERRQQPIVVEPQRTTVIVHRPCIRQFGAIVDVMVTRSAMIAKVYLTIVVIAGVVEVFTKRCAVGSLGPRAVARRQLSWLQLPLIWASSECCHSDDVDYCQEAG